ncbi:MAG TPA: cyanophycin synthetase [bacterium]|jgi:dihydrofolate synthase/folylpolyglutamate synthase
MWTFEEVQKYLADTAPPGKSVYGLERINHLLEITGHPEKGMACITVVGTNGKGSTLAFLDSILLEHGMKTVCHIKPHVESVTERMRINGRDSTEDEFASAMWEVKQAVDEKWIRDDKPTYFELIFAGTLIFGRMNEAEIAILETGLGGRLDAVNAVDAMMVLLTSVSYDHTEYLGETLTEITGEKVVVARRGTTLVAQENPEEVTEVVRHYCEENGVRYVRKREYLSAAEDNKYESVRWNLQLSPDSPVIELKPQLKANYQLENADLAISGFYEFANSEEGERLDISPDIEKVKAGIEKAHIPGRWEIFNIEGGVHVLVDGGHNTEALNLVLGEYRNYCFRKKTIIFGAKKTKDLHEVLPKIVEVGRHIIFCPVPDIEYHEPSELVVQAEKYVDRENKSIHIELYKVDSIEEGLEKAIEVTEGPVMVTGSIYLAGAAMRHIRKKMSLSGTTRV